jgi:hypothetical protein
LRTEQTQWTAREGWTHAGPRALGAAAQLVLVFGAGGILKNPEPLEALRRAYPAAHVMGCSTAGEICGTRVHDDSLVATAVHFEHSEVRGAQTRLANAEDSFGAGQRLAAALPHDGLVHVFVLAEGTTLNGSALVSGLAPHLPQGVSVTGGLAGDGDRFQETLAFWDATPAPQVAAALGLYGSRLRVGFGSLGGWDAFGPERLITRSRGHVLHELDGRSALDLYKTYLGEHAKDLPASALLFPLSIRAGAGGEDIPVVRTVLGIDEADHSMTFAGDVPVGAYARFMKANFDRLIDGATGAARASYQPIGDGSPDLAILISCVGRKLVLKQRVEEEVEAVRDVVGPRTVLSGFYSYGELGPLTPSARCELHNQTMTITTLSEA